MRKESKETKQIMSEDKLKEKSENYEVTIYTLQKEITQLRSEIQDLRRMVNTISEEIKKERQVLEIQLDKLLFLTSFLEKQYSDFLSLIGELDSKMSALKFSLKVGSKEDVKNEKN